MKTQPLRQTTLALIQRARKEFALELGRIADLAHADEEIPDGSQLNMKTEPPSWLVPDKDAGALQ